MSTTTPFCTDADLIQWEPNVLNDATFVSQTLLAGTGDLSGTSFSIAAGSLADVAVEKDFVIVLAGDVAGCYPIVSIDSETVMTLPVAVADGGATLNYVIRTFAPQRAIITALLAQAAGIDSSRPGESPPVILNPSALRRPCALGTLQLIYSALAAASPDDAHFDVRAQLYERLYRRALRSVTVDVDLNGDGVADAHRMLSVLNFRRS